MVAVLRKNIIRVLTQPFLQTNIRGATRPRTSLILIYSDKDKEKRSKQLRAPEHIHLWNCGIKRSNPKKKGTQRLWPNTALERTSNLLVFGVE